MQLTGRALVMALAACVISGAVFGIVTSLARAAQPPSPAPQPTTTGPTLTPMPGPTGLGDDIASYPLPTSSATPLPQSTPSQESRAGVELPETPTTTATPSAMPATSPDSDVATTSQRPTRHSSAAAAPARAQKTRPDASRPSTPDAGIPLTSASTSRPTSPRVTKPANGWRPPVLRVGDNDISGPELTSGSDVGMVIGCSPSSACSLAGGMLTITADAAVVNVSWSAPRTRGYPAWQASVDWSTS